MSVDLSTVKKYQFEDGTTIHLRIDFERNRVSFVERNGLGEYQPKKWLFADRGLEYMNGWLNILEAMKYAVNDAKKLLQERKDQDTDKFIDLLAELNELGDD